MLWFSDYLDMIYIILIRAFFPPHLMFNLWFSRMYLHQTKCNVKLISCISNYMLCIKLYSWFFSLLRVIIIVLSVALCCFAYWITMHLKIQRHSFADVVRQKQPSKGVLKKSCSENMQLIYRRRNTPKCDFNKVAKQLY